VVTAENALFSYKCTDYYAPEHDGSIMWNDPAIGIEWPVESPSLSEKDRAAPLLAGMPEQRLPRYKGG
jgi:dTDP-4-dehydrorhamnose 3,5-epimerase